MDLRLPLDYQAIERILPHRYPFLLVDRVTELELDKRIVGIKNVSLNERYLTVDSNGSAALPPMILTEDAQFPGIGDRLPGEQPHRRRLAGAVGAEQPEADPGGPVEIEAVVLRLRSRMGLLKGVARVNGQRIVEGTMTFALGDPAKP